ncbi:MAG: alpha/beta hydrolase [Acidobacteriaceae bacterium]
MASMVAVTMACAQTPVAAPAWMDSTNWASVRPVETHNIVYANMPVVKNPSVLNPSRPGGAVLPTPSIGGTVDLHLDVFQMPSAKPAPVVVHLHGGGWTAPAGQSHSPGLFTALLAAGISVVSVQYRSSLEAPAPAALQDVHCALSWLKANAAKYNFDVNRVILYGVSAGGELALMAAYAPDSFDPPGCTDQPKVAAVLDYYGPPDLAEALLHEPGSGDFVRQWLGLALPLPADHAVENAENGTPAPVRWPEPSAAELALAKQLSPMNYIRPGVPPTYIVNGDRDPRVNPEQDSKLKVALDAAGVPAGHDIIPGAGHGNFPKPEANKAWLLCLQFLEAQGILQ